MDYLKEFNHIMQEEKEIALASCTDNRPNVRIVNFYYDPRQKGTLYFSTFRNNDKVSEFDRNDSVAFTTIPKEGNRHVRVRQGRIRKSSLTVFDLKNGFTEKIPAYEETIAQAGSHLDLYEILFHEASVTLDMHHSSEITL